MRLWKFPSTYAGHFVTALLMGTLASGPAGCTTSGSIDSASVDPRNPFGFLINSDVNSKLLGGVRLNNDTAVWAYGNFNADGSIRDISSAVLWDADGKLTQITFVDGLPDKAEGPDGSTMDVTYTIRTQTRLAGSVELFLAGLSDADAHQTISFDVDLQQAADQLAQQVEELTGLNVYDEPPPPEPKDGGGRVQIADGVSNIFGKDAAQSQFSLVLLAPLYVFAFASVGYVLVQVMAKVVEVMSDVLVGVVTAITQVFVIAVSAPFILLGDLLRQSATQPLTLLNLALAQRDGHLNLPPPPDL